MGCLFAALLTEAEHEVWLLDKSAERANKIALSGIHIEGIGGSRIVRPNTTSNPQDIGVVDLIFIWVKAYDTERAVKTVIPILTEHTQVISLQNGLGNVETIAKIVNPRNVIGGITSHGATLLDIGSIRHAGKGDTIIGRIHKQALLRGVARNEANCCEERRKLKQSEGLKQIAKLLSAAGIETKISKDIESTIWSKLIINAAINPLTAITRLKNGQLLESIETRRLLDLVAEESEKIVALAGISLAYPNIKNQVYSVCESTAQNTSSMLQDILRMKETEIDAINGALVEKAKALNIEVPVNEMLACLVKIIERTH